MDDKITPTTNENFVTGNNFYISGAIDEYFANQIIKPLREKIDELSKVSKDSKPTIKFFINSPGGYVHLMMQTLAMFDECQRKGIVVETYVDGYAFSAAAIIAVYGHKRYATKRSSFMFHSMRSWGFSHNSEMAEREADWYKWVDSEMVKMVEEKTKITGAREKMIPDLYYVNGLKLKVLGCVDELL